MKTSTLLKRAEKHLWDGLGDLDGLVSVYICTAVRYADVDAESPASVAIRDEIMRRLDGPRTYEGWASAKGHLPPGHWSNRRNWLPLIQANRLNWLRELQRQFKAKGD